MGRRFAVGVVGCALAACSASSSAGSNRAGSAGPLVSAECVDPVADALHRLESVPAESRPETVLLADLDGDGLRDLAVSEAGWCGSGGCRFHLYLRRGECGVWVGELESSGFEARGPGPEGIADLATTVQGGSCSWTEGRARFQGGRYRVRQQRDCRCVAWAAGTEPPPASECEPWRSADVPLR